MAQRGQEHWLFDVLPMFMLRNYKQNNKETSPPNTRLRPGMAELLLARARTGCLN